MSRETVRDITTTLCGELTRIGCEYDCEFDNRGGNGRSDYIFIHKPLPAKIRVASHPSRRIDKDKGHANMLIIDVGVGPSHKNGVTWQEAVAQIAAVTP